MHKIFKENLSESSEIQKDVGNKETSSRKFFSSRSGVICHVNAHINNIKCNICGKLFQDHYDMNRHKTIDRQSDHPAAWETCGRMFSTHHHLRYHLKTRENNINKCKICSKNFTLKRSLINHVKKQECKDELKCPYCDKIYSIRHQMKVHLRKHTGEHLFKCDHCDAAYRESNQLTVYKRIHFGEKLFTCEYCGKGFIVKSRLTRHLRSHTDEGHANVRNTINRMQT